MGQSLPTKHNRSRNGFASTANTLDTRWRGSPPERSPWVFSFEHFQTMSKLAILATAIVGSSAFAPSNLGGRLVSRRRRQPVARRRPAGSLDEPLNTVLRVDIEPSRRPGCRRAAGDLCYRGKAFLTFSLFQLAPQPRWPRSQPRFPSSRLRRTARDMSEMLVLTLSDFRTSFRLTSFVRCAQHWTRISNSSF